MRFYKEISNGIAFSDCEHLEKFFIVSSAFKCDVNKLTRTPNDLRIMGDFCKLEYHLLAHIKQVTNAAVFTLSSECTKCLTGWLKSSSSV